MPRTITMPAPISRPSCSNGCWITSPQSWAPELQQWLLDHEPAILGGDMLSFDHPEDTSMPFIRAFFRTGGMILCPLMGLAELPCDLVTLCAAPTRLTSANAAPCRALAWCDEQ